ncbi:hypothetical protein Y032_0096g2950 [Ancylostoma ceylanicum]|uniref:ShKT domain-containing protein n=2 Tax=Ancylostoma ceylanicum TaxID=53326 RepID=A0A016TKF3_9BILA|nr:hypothetical protein Y032_0096g2950 [Ancylostoma ceylanicum]
MSLPSITFYHHKRIHCHSSPLQNRITTCVEMFLYALTLLLVLNAFTQDVMAQPCADRVPGPVCKQMKDKGNCNNPAFEMVAKMQCAKTCGFCQ